MSGMKRRGLSSRNAPIRDPVLTLSEEGKTGILDIKFVLS
jgi:hypothetical protein